MATDGSLNYDDTCYDALEEPLTQTRERSPSTFSLKTIEDNNDTLGTQMNTMALVAAFMAAVISGIMTSVTRPEMIEADAAWNAVNNNTNCTSAAGVEDINNAQCVWRIGGSQPLSWWISRMAALSGTLDIFVVVVSMTVYLFSTLLPRQTRQQVDLTVEVRPVVIMSYVALVMASMTLLPNFYFIA